MLPWKLLDVATIPGGGALRLKQRGDEFSIALGGIELMNSRHFASEETLGTLACGRLQGRPAPSVLIGGLGMGFTLRAALSRLGPRAAVTVAELVPAVVAWASGPLSALFGTSLDDGRVRIEVADVGRVIARAAGAYDAILLDVDNGPEGLSRESNDELYGLAGLRSARRALRRDGILAVWSSVPDPAFTRRLSKAGFRPDEVRARADRGRRGSRHVIWIAQRGA